MGRPKLFDREDILEKAMPVFWKHGYAHTSIQDLEKATGVNKSGLYSEFKDKEDLFLETLKYYFAHRKNREFLKREPYGWKNIEDYLLFSARSTTLAQKGCFGVATMRELEWLPDEARNTVNGSRKILKGLWIQNIAAEKTRGSPESISEVLSTFYSGLCIHQNLKMPKAVLKKAVSDFIVALKQL
jgi:TetR/AcrR family transcriptional regulator, copper-responsive repressor